MRVDQSSELPALPGAAPRDAAGPSPAAMRRKWGETDVPGLSAIRAETLGLSPSRRAPGYAHRDQDAQGRDFSLPPLLQHPSDCARFLHRTSELLLQCSKDWELLRQNTIPIEEYFEPELRQARRKEMATSSAEEIARRLTHRPETLAVLAQSLPGLLRGKRRDLEMYGEDTAGGLEAQTALEQLCLVEEMVASLVALQNTRPLRGLRGSDFELRRAGMQRGSEDARRRLSEVAPLL